MWLFAWSSEDDVGRRPTGPPRSGGAIVAVEHAAQPFTDRRPGRPHHDVRGRHGWRPGSEGVPGAVRDRVPVRRRASAGGQRRFGRASHQLQLRLDRPAAERPILPVQKLCRGESLENGWLTNAGGSRELSLANDGENPYRGWARIYRVMGADRHRRSRQLDGRSDLAPHAANVVRVVDPLRPINTIVRDTWGTSWPT